MNMPGSLIKLAVVTLSFVVLSLASPHEAHAQSIIKQPGNHPKYSFEAEPHGVIGWDPPGPAHDTGLGLGFRGTVTIVDNGFVSTINNSIGIGFGLDWIHYDDDDFDYWCRGNRFCDDPRFNDFDVDFFVLPIVLQWNFWLHRQWSVFGEVGGAIGIISADEFYGDDDVEFFPFLFFGGGRFHFSDAAALTMRIGYPYFSIGVSFLL
jgi:hypothetical protein